MSLIKWLGGVTQAEHAELAAEVERIRNLSGADEQLELTRQAQVSATSAAQDANSAANSAAVAAGNSQAAADHAQAAANSAQAATSAAVTATASVDALNESLANHAVKVAELDQRVSALETGQPDQPDPTPTPSGGFDLRPNPTFDPNNPILKDGTRLTGEALAAWQGIRWLFADYRARRSVEAGGSVDGLAQRDDTYHLGRVKLLSDYELLLLYALTGWDAVLAEATRQLVLQHGTLKVGYGSPLGPNAKQPPAPYRAWRWSQSDAEYQGVTYHIDAHLAHAPLAAWLVAMEAAAHPEAATWQAYFRDHYLPLWRGPRTQGGAGWESNHAHLRHAAYATGGRPGVNRPSLPIATRQHTHTHVTLSSLHHFLGETTVLPQGERARAIEIGREGIADFLLRRNLYAYDGVYGEQGFIPRTLMHTGHQTGEFYPLPTTYAGYTVSDVTLAGLLGHIEWSEYQRFGRLFTRSICQHALPGMTGSDAIASTHMADVAPTGRNAAGQTVTLERASVGSRGQFVNPRNHSNLIHNNYGLLLPFDPDGTLRAAIDRSNSAVSSSVAQPKTLAVNLGIILKAALA